MPEPTRDDRPTPTHDERLESIETAVAFQAHEQDALNAQVVALHETVGALQRRLLRLEARLEEVALPGRGHADPGAEAPPDDGNASLDDEQFHQDRPPHWGRAPGRSE